MAIYFPVGAGQPCPVFLTPFPNRVVSITKPFVTAKMGGCGNQPGGRARTDDSSGTCEWGGDFHTTLEGDSAIEIHRDMPAGTGELSGPSECPNLPAEGRYHSGELALSDTGADHRGELSGNGR